MIISTIIHGLEVATLLLVGLLTYQLVRCYRAFYAGSESAQIQNSDVDARAQAEIEEPGIVVEEPSASTLAASESVSLEQEQTSASKEILNDYIGGFFAEASVPDLQAFKADTQVTPDTTASTADVEPLEPLETVAVSKEQLAEFRAPETIEPILVKPVRVVDLDEEDTFIVVEDEDVECHSGNDNVMSDKVVHAMLKEARLVASS